MYTVVGCFSLVYSYASTTYLIIVYIPKLYCYGKIWKKNKRQGSRKCIQFAAKALHVIVRLGRTVGPKVPFFQLHSRTYHLIPRSGRRRQTQGINQGINNSLQIPRHLLPMWRIVTRKSRMDGTPPSELIQIKTATLTPAWIRPNTERRYSPWNNNRWRSQWTSELG